VAVAAMEKRKAQAQALEGGTMDRALIKGCDITLAIATGGIVAVLLTMLFQWPWFFHVGVWVHASILMHLRLDDAETR
jgi:uncharacterized membrane protein YgaE (UPF0421/DUF939 family)